MNSLQEVAKAIIDSNSVLISGHVMPDGDSIGSTIALGLFMESLGKKVTMTSPDMVPDLYNFLPGVHRLHRGLPKGEYDTLVILDCSVPERLGNELIYLLNGDIKVINIDHHPGTSYFADINYIDASAAATGEIIFDLIRLMNAEINTDIASNLYVAIVADTGSFRYESTTSNTHHRVAELLKYGVSVSDISNKLYDEKPIEVFRVLQAALPNLTISDCGRVAWISLDWHTKRILGAKDEYTDDLISYPRRIRGVEVALFFREISPGNIKVSMRSNNYVDVNKLAAMFDGGGHKRASGCLISGGIEAVIDRVVKAAMESVIRGS